jgi:hypothetical protein
VSPTGAVKTHVARNGRTVTYCGRKIVPSFPRGHEVARSAIITDTQAVTCAACRRYANL